MTKLQLWLAVGFAVLMRPSLICADPPPPPKWTGDASAIPPTMARDLVRELRFGSFTARFEETPLEDIGKQLGASPFGQSGDASEFARWVCYSLPGQLVWLIGGEMSGGRMDVVVVDSVPDSDSRRQLCPAIPSHRRPVSFEFGWVGTSEAELHSRLGKPSRSRGAWQLFYFEGKASLPYREPGSAQTSIAEFDVMSQVEAKLDGGKVVSIRAWHSMQN